MKALLLALLLLLPALSRGWTVSLYEHTNFRGARHSFSGTALSVRKSVAGCFNDRASSAIIASLPNECFCFHTHHEGNGLSKCWIGQGRPSDFVIDGINDAITSVSIYASSDRACMTNLHNPPFFASTVEPGC